MAESKKTTGQDQPSKGQRVRDKAQDRSSRRGDYAAGADGEQGVTPGPAKDDKPVPDGQLGPDEISEPDELLRNNEAKLHLENAQPDHSEREWGGDQDIDTAGMIPGNKATDDHEPTGS